MFETIEQFAEILQKSQFKLEFTAAQETLKKIHAIISPPAFKSQITKGKDKFQTREQLVKILIFINLLEEPENSMLLGMQKDLSRIIQTLYIEEDNTLVTYDENTNFVAKASPILVDMIYEFSHPDVKTVNYMVPQQIEAQFNAFNQSLQFPAVQQSNSTSILVRMLKTIIYSSCQVSSPLFNNQLSTGTDPIAIVAGWLVMALSINSSTYEIAPCFQLIECAMLDKIARVFGFKQNSVNLQQTVSQQQQLQEQEYQEQYDYDGIFVPGGAISNIYGIQAALHHHFPALKQKGHDFQTSPVGILVSDQSHYSWQKGANLCGLGMHSVYTVKSDINGEMIRHELESKIIQLIEKGVKPILLSLTSGTTVMGAYDNLEELIPVARKYNMQVHVDGAWGGQAIFSQRLKHLVQGIWQADSMTWDPHKHIGAGFLCSVFLVKGKDRLQAINGFRAPYLFQKDKLNTEYDIGDKTFYCGRKADACKLWLMWKGLGDEGLARRVDTSYDNIQFMKEQMLSRKDSSGRNCFMLTSAKNVVSLCFYYIPERLRQQVHEQNFNGQPLTEEIIEQLKTVSVQIKKCLQMNGKCLIAFCDVKHYKNSWRMTMSGPSQSLTKEMILSILDSFELYGNNL